MKTVLCTVYRNWRMAWRTHNLITWSKQQYRVQKNQNAKVFRLSTLKKYEICVCVICLGNLEVNLVLPTLTRSVLNRLRRDRRKKAEKLETSCALLVGHIFQYSHSHILLYYIQMMFDSMLYVLLLYGRFDSMLYVNVNVRCDVRM